MNNFYNYNPYYNQQPQYTQPMQQRINYLPIYIVNSKDDITSHIVMANSSVFLLAEKDNLLCLKKADNMGQYSYDFYSLGKLDTNNQNTSQYALKCDLEALEKKIDELNLKLGGGTNE